MKGGDIKNRVMPKRQIVKACCGKKALIIYFDSAFKKEHISIFNTHGYSAPQQYTKAGIMYLRKDTLTAIATFGSKHANVRCGGQQCLKYIEEFEKIAEEILASSS